MGTTLFRKTPFWQPQSSFYVVEFPKNGDLVDNRCDTLSMYNLPNCLQVQFKTKKYAFSNAGLKIQNTILTELYSKKGYISRRFFSLLLVNFNNSEPWEETFP